MERSGTVQFGFGVPEVVNLITLVADRTEEGSGQFRVVLSNPVGCALAPVTAGSGLQTIVDDDGMLLMHDTGTAQNMVRKVSTLTSEAVPGSTTRSAVLVENVGGKFSTLGDADGDDLADLFRLNVMATESRLDIVPGVDGTTPLRATVALDMTGTGLLDVAAGDVTGDGLDDLVELRYRDSDALRTIVVRVAPAFGESYWQSLAPSQVSRALRLSDINDDGCSDIHIQGLGFLEVLNGRTLARLIYSGASPLARQTIVDDDGVLLLCSESIQRAPEYPVAANPLFRLATGTSEIIPGASSQSALLSTGFMGGAVGAGGIGMPMACRISSCMTDSNCASSPGTMAVRSPPAWPCLTPLPKK